ncbi:MAG: hypothetical protein KAJ19_02935 [Gammaproteobacteria bacterium]|nr:hypothetical protein [Gammaproteobacteria bacterium]
MTDLAERIEGGETLGPIGLSQLFFGPDDDLTINEAIDYDKKRMIIREALGGSLDACQTLMAELLPGWGVEWDFTLNIIEGECLVCLWKKEKGTKPHNGKAKTPAQAWLAAIIRAVESEADNGK